MYIDSRDCHKEARGEWDEESVTLDDDRFMQMKEGVV